MKFLLIVLAFASVTLAQDVCCLAEGATSCTPEIPLELCMKAKGSVVDPSTTAPPVSLEGTCCCFGAFASDSDRCLPGVERSVCLGVSVNGRCQEEEEESCCCRPAGVESDLNCVPRIPVPLCEKAAGAECVVAQTETPSCNCQLPPAPGSPDEDGEIKFLLTSICTKFNGECIVAPDQCCCIVKPTFDPFTNVEIFPDPTDPDVPANGQCIYTSRELCETTKKRDGQCWTGLPTPPPAPLRCRCQDPAFTNERAIRDDDGQDALLLVHVCEDKIGSSCIPDRCCCKYPSAPNDPCIANILETTCGAVGGARCINVNEFADVQDFGNAAFLSPDDLICSEVSESNDPRSLIRVSGYDGTRPASEIPGFNGNNVNVFAQQLEGDTEVYLGDFFATLTVDVSPMRPDFLLYLINLKGTSQTINPSVYTIDIQPTTTIPAVLSGLVGGDGLVAAPTTDSVPGRYRITFPNTAAVSGVLAFSGPVSRVTVTFAARLPTAPIDSFVTSGIVPTFVTGSATPLLELAPGLRNPNPSYTLVDGDDPDIVTVPPLFPSACEEEFADPIAFPRLPPSQFFNLDGVTLGSHLNIDFGSPQDPDSICLYIADLGPGTYTLVQNDPLGLGVASPPVIDSTSSTGAMMVGWDLVITTDFSGVIKFLGQPSNIQVFLSSMTRKRFSDVNLVCGPCNPKTIPTPTLAATDLPPTLYAAF